MLTADSLRKSWENLGRFAAIEPALTITEAGLVLGAGTVLAKHMTTAGGSPALAVTGNEERILALLTVACARRVDPGVIGHIHRTAASCSRGEIDLARIHLAYARLPSLGDAKTASYRLFLADELLNDGMPPRELLVGCGLDPSALDAIKAGFNPDEPRVPAGNPDGGEWTTSGDAEAAPQLMSPIGNGTLVGIAYPGDYHDALVAQLANAVRSTGGVVLTEVPLTAIDGTNARADMIVLPHGWHTPFVMEVKTGPGSSLTPNQAIVYQMLPVGGYVTATKNGLEALGLASGQPLPPLRLFIVYSSGPGDLRGIWWPPLH